MLQVDQLFSILANELKKEDILTIEELVAIISSAPLEPSAICNRLMYIYDWKEFIEDKLSSPQLKNISKYNSFQFVSEDRAVKFRAKRFPQDHVYFPPSGIRIVQDNIIFEPVTAAEFRTESIKFDEIWKGLELTLAQLCEDEQNRITISWDRLRKYLESLPDMRQTLKPMHIFDLPRQHTELVSFSIPQHLSSEEFQPELSGDRYPDSVLDGEFRADTAEDMDVVVYTEDKASRPWVGRVLSVLPGNRFLLQWFTRKTVRSRTFYALSNKDGSPCTAELDNSSVMYWCMSEKRTQASFELSAYWLEVIKQEYRKLDDD